MNPDASAPQNHRRRNASSGFTLIEVMLAIFIFGIVIATVFGSFRFVSTVTEAVDGYTDDFQMAANCLNRMISDIQAVHVARPPAYAKPGLNDDPNPYRIVGGVGGVGMADFPSLRFCSSAHLGFGERAEEGIAQIVYYVTQDDVTDTYVLKRSDILPPYPEAFQPDNGDPILCERIKSLAFVYYDEEGEKRETWESESRQRKYATPRAVQVTLEIGDEDDSLTFETMIEFPVYREEID